MDQRRLEMTGGGCKYTEQATDGQRRLGIDGGGWK